MRRVRRAHRCYHAGRARRVERVLQPLLQGPQPHRVATGTATATTAGATSRTAARAASRAAERHRLRPRPQRGASTRTAHASRSRAGCRTRCRRSTTRAPRRCRSAAASSSTIMRAARASRSRCKVLGRERVEDPGRHLRLRRDRADAQGRRHLQEQGPAGDLAHRRRAPHAGADEEQGDDRLDQRGAAGSQGRAPDVRATARPTSRGSRVGSVGRARPPRARRGLRAPARARAPPRAVLDSLPDQLAARALREVVDRVADGAPRGPSGGGHVRRPRRQGRRVALPDRADRARRRSRTWR